VGDIVDIAARIRDELAALLAAGDVPEVESELSALVERGRRGEPVDTPILRLLRDHPVLRERANELSDMSGRAVAPPPGEGRVALSPRYVCPHGDFEFFRIDVSRPVPVCPHDGTRLVPGDQA
jgi:hypothetical protein